MDSNDKNLKDSTVDSSSEIDIELSFDPANFLRDLENRDSNQTSSNELESNETPPSEDDLPVATPVENDTCASNELIETNQEIVIDGVVVEANKSKGKMMECFGLAIFILFIVIAGILLAETKAPSSELDISDQSVPISPSPTITSSPTTVFDYESFMEQIAIQVSGEEVSKDPTTLQSKIWKALAADMPRLIAKSILQLNDTEKIVQRYAITVVGGASSRVKPQQELKLILPDECDIPFFECDENGFLTAVFLENQWSLQRGGGIIAREIGALLELREIRVTRSAVIGTIPSEIGTLMNLRILDLNDNLLTGPIPSEIGQLQNLQLFRVDQNELDGGIPSEMGLMKSLVYMDSSSNSLSGSIPSEIALLDNLEGLNIIGNSMEGNLEHFCENQNISSEEYKISILSEYRPSYHLDPGIRISCDESDRKVLCSCCICG